MEITGRKQYNVRYDVRKAFATGERKKNKEAVPYEVFHCF